MHELGWGAALLVLVTLFYSRNSHKLPFPPGPTGLPLLGVLGKHPKTEAWKTYAEWGRLFGSSGLISFHILGRRILVVNSKAVADNLFTKRSANYNDRPLLTFAGRIMRREKSLFLRSYDDRCKSYRRLMQQAFNPNSSQLYWSIQEDVGRKTIERILQTPDKLVQHLRWNAGFVTMKLAYGYTIQDEDDHFVAIAEEASRIIAVASAPGKWLVDSIPILRHIPDWFPGAAFKRQANEWSRHLNNMALEPHEWVKQQIKTGVAFPSFSAQLLQDANGELTTDSELDDLVLWSAGALYTAGTDTTVSVMKNFFFCMMLHPEVQSRGQQEIDRFMNEENRLPSLKDWSQGALPYVTCIVQEILRWHPVAPFGIPHATAHEDVYEGYYIPKKVTVIGNIWAMLHDESVYPQPETFDPDRFSGKDGRKVEDDPRSIVFGFGRRICPGRYIAEASIWIQIATALACLQIDKPLGEELEVAFTSGLLSHVKPYPYKISERNAKAVEWMKLAIRANE